MTEDQRHRAWALCDAVFDDNPLKIVWLFPEASLEELRATVEAASPAAMRCGTIGNFVLRLPVELRLVVEG